MSGLNELGVIGACGDRLFHIKPGQPDGPTYIICSAHPEEDGEVVNEGSTLTDLSGERTVTQPDDNTTDSVKSEHDQASEARLRVLGNYSCSYCSSCTNNPNTREPQPFKHIGGIS